MSSGGPAAPRGGWGGGVHSPAVATNALSLLVVRQDVEQVLWRHANINVPALARIAKLVKRGWVQFHLRLTSMSECGKGYRETEFVPRPPSASPESLEETRKFG